MGSVRAFSDGAEAVEGGDAEGGGEVAVGGASGGGLVELEAKLGGQTAGLFVECDGARLALHRRTVETAGDGELTVWIGAAQRVEEPVDADGVAGMSDAHIDLGEGVFGNDVGARAAGDDAGIYGEAAAQIGEAGDGLQEAREFQNRRVAAGEVDAAVRGDASDFDAVAADALARGLAGEALRGFQYQNCLRGQREPLGDGTRCRAANLFVAVQQQRDGRLTPSCVSARMAARAIATPDFMSRTPGP